jgi:hypothetical protein
MYVTVSLTIEIDASTRLSDMERQIEQAGRAGMKEAQKLRPSPKCRASEDLPGVWKRSGTDARNEAQSLVDSFRAGGSAPQAAPVSTVPPSLSSGRALFSRGQGLQHHTGFARTGRAGWQFLAL